MGKLIHELFFLRSKKKKIIVCPEARRTAVIKEQNLEFDPDFKGETYFEKGQRLGLPVVLEKNYLKILKTVSQAWNNLNELGYKKEHCSHIEEEFYDDERKFKAKIDCIYIKDSTRILVDLKSTNLSLENSESAFYEALKYLYDLQLAHYVDILNHTNKMVDKVEIWFLSKSKNQKIVILELSEDFLLKGLDLRNLALKVLSQRHDLKYKISTLNTELFDSEEKSALRLNYYQKMHDL